MIIFNGMDNKSSVENRLAVIIKINLSTKFQKYLNDYKSFHGYNKITNNIFKTIFNVENIYHKDFKLTNEFKEFIIANVLDKENSKTINHILYMILCNQTIDHKQQYLMSLFKFFNDKKIKFIDIFKNISDFIGHYNVNTIDKTLKFYQYYFNNELYKFIINNEDISNEKKILCSIYTIIHSTNIDIINKSYEFLWQKEIFQLLINNEENFEFTQLLNNIIKYYFNYNDDKIQKLISIINIVANKNINYYDYLIIQKNFNNLNPNFIDKELIDHTEDLSYHYCPIENAYNNEFIDHDSENNNFNNINNFDDFICKKYKITMEELDDIAHININNNIENINQEENDRQKNIIIDFTDCSYDLSHTENSNMRSYIEYCVDKDITDNMINYKKYCENEIIQQKRIMEKARVLKEDISQLNFLDIN